jgi:SAM-dependent methyltransferase/GT2 family glycosyltransferase
MTKEAQTVSTEIKRSKGRHTDPAKQHYQNLRIAHWDRVSPQKEIPRRAGAFYQKLLQHYYKFLIPSGMRVLEVGCGHGDLLACLKPSFGVGIDFSSAMIQRALIRHPHLNFIQAEAHEIAFKEKFDVIILSDLVNDLWDAQQVFERLSAISYPGTRLILNFYNNLWRMPLSMVKQLGLGADVLEQNWFSPNDIFNLLELSGFEVIQHRPSILLPLSVLGLSTLANRYLVNLIPFSWLALTNFVIARPENIGSQNLLKEKPSVSVIIPARNEAGNIENILKRVPTFGGDTELVFVEGNSSDKTYEAIEQTIRQFPDRKCKLLRQPDKGKGDAVRLGFEEAEGDVLMILDADMTVPPEDLLRFAEALASGKGEFINGVRLVYPLENQSMRFLNMVGNKFFSLAFSWLLGQPIKDTLCGTKVLWKRDYVKIANNRDYFGDFDPFGDFDLLFGAAKLNFKIVEIPIRYRSRIYGETNIKRWQHGWLLLKMVWFAARRIKFI